MLLFFAGLGSAAGLLAANYFFFHYGARAKAFDLDALGKMPERTVVYDVHGELIGRLHGANRIMVDLEHTSRPFLEALLAREDVNFYKHGGVDYRGVARAIVRNLRDREFSQGASTITMQLARNSYGLTAESLDRKLLEIMLTRRIEKSLSKNRILELYINRIFFGSGIYGLERACEAYLGKKSADLTLGEAAMLAGIIRSPNRFSPFRNKEGALRERDTVLDRMVKTGFISPDEATIAKSLPIEIQEEPTSLWQENYAMDHVRRELERVLWDADYKEDGGLQVYTTIDQKIQLAAEQALEKHLAAEEASAGYPHPTKAQYTASLTPGEQRPTDYMQGSVVVLDNQTGGVFAIVGGRSFDQSQFNRALHAKRQVGSVFKPFVFAAAYERSSLLPQVLINDDRIGPSELPGLDRPWSPGNSDRTYRGFQTADFGLVKSRNTMTVRVGELVGVEPIVQLAHELGLTDRDRRAPSSPVTYIGAFESTPLQVTAAYTVFPNDGVRRQPHLFRKIIDRGGHPLNLVSGISQPVIEAGAASLAADSLQEVMKSGTGASAGRLGWTGPAAGKTGTTDDYRDAWFVGYTSSLTCGVWVGMDNNQTTVDGGYGSSLALPVWVDVMNEAKELGYAAEALSPGPDRQNLGICQLSGALATDSCEAHGSAITVAVPEDLVNRPVCELHRGYPRSGPATPGPGPGPSPYASPRPERRAPPNRPGPQRSPWRWFSDLLR